MDNTGQNFDEISKSLLGKDAVFSVVVYQKIGSDSRWKGYTREEQFTLTITTTETRSSIDSGIEPKSMSGVSKTYDMKFNHKQSAENCAEALISLCN